ncbi:hypothetical protein Ga0609869_001526 [Rhodovulum iodosum]|uniref:HupE/UreJ family protein n=1 Tax=Rhodovulum iodosum TaxID=68291 RepID=A0ABV3XV09_9RHOB|nr:hypothetical protein [Rhodovulum robiginosum]RSK30506.1 hypothetical protein EJA01_17170 [Rhodovulum robiginosum]
MRRAAALALFLAAPRAEAHAFRSGSESYAAFVEGASVPLNDPGILICLAATGLALGIWRARGLPAVWPALIVGLAAGLALAPLAPVWSGIAALGLGILAAVMGVTALPWPRWALATLAASAGLLAGFASLQGHGWGELPLSVALGVFFGAHLALVVPAGLVEACRRRLVAPWVMIGWRVAASWLGAVALLLGALSLTPAA